MALNESTGNMYEFVTHTWNVIKGKCPHNCGYCYMKRRGEQKPIRFDESELKTDLGTGNFIFVGSSCDMFADAIPREWILKILNHCNKFDNKYLLQTKNPARYINYQKYLPKNFILGTTIETNRRYDEMGDTISPFDRAEILSSLYDNKTFITIEPIIDFDVVQFADLLNITRADWINIGADSGNNNLPEPSKEKIDGLTELLLGKKITIKKNMKRIK